MSVTASSRGGRCSPALRADPRRPARDRRGRAQTFGFGPPDASAARPDRGPRPARLRLGAAGQHRARRGLRRGAVVGRRPGRAEPDRLPQPRPARRPAAPAAAAARPAAARRRAWCPKNTAPGRAREHLRPLRPRQPPVRVVPRRADDVLGGRLRRPGRDPRAGAADEARADLRRARARPRRPPARDRHRLGRARGPRRRDPRLPGDDDDDLARAARLRRASGSASAASTTGSSCC